MSVDTETPPLQMSDLAIGDAVFWETPWSKRIAALVVELGDKRVRVVLRRRREVSDYWTPITRLARAERTRHHDRLETEAERFLQRRLFPG